MGIWTRVGPRVATLVWRPTYLSRTVTTLAFPLQEHLARARRGAGGGRRARRPPVLRARGVTGGRGRGAAAREGRVPGSGLRASSFFVFPSGLDSGLRFHYVATGERGKPLMLLLHGFPEFWYSWRHQLREFKSDYRVVALDLRGYGETDAPVQRENYKLDCLITDIKDILDSLGYSKCVLIGHDWGGMIAWLIAICYPEMVMKLIVLNFPHPNVFTEYILRHPAQLFKSSYYYFFQIPRFPEFMFSINDFKALKHLFTSHSTGIGRKGCRLTTEDLEAYIYVFSQPGALSGPINHYRNIFSCLPLKHHMVTTPTLLLWGEKDAFMEVEMAEVTKIYVKNYFRLTILSEASHWLQQDQPDIVNTLIWTFLKEETRKKD
ncbi:epoxide hydrolase 4 [Carlito syrichta]|uniref:Epoxide hydrolase 4 n=1 Tax=Carlito syrichta TaxID=1868482 RepID=A0A3Q0EGF9_CARSF|nr:epoxide hydrolase 4 [Carlito syrichta]